MDSIMFLDETHARIYNECLERMRHKDSYHQATAYLLGADVVLREHIEDVFDFEEDSIKPQTALQHPWQTGTSRKTTRLLMNLWNGCVEDYDGDGEGHVSYHYAVDEIFSCSYASIYWEAIKLRFPQYVPISMTRKPGQPPAKYEMPEEVFKLREDME